MAKRATIDDVRPVLNELDKVVDVADETIDKVEQAVDHGVEAVEHAVETGVHVAAKGGHKAVHFLRSPRMAAIVIFTCGVAGAGYVGWKLSQRHYAKKYEERLEFEIGYARDFYARRNKADEYATPEEAAKALIGEVAEEDAHILTETEAAEALKQYQGEKTDYNKVKLKADEVVKDIPPEVVKSNVFVNGKPLNPDEFDYDTEVPLRSAETPYVITFDEFMQNDRDYAQTTFTYFEGDDILTDERDEIIQDVEGTIGTDNLVRFGAGSKDPNVVYIRNDRTSIDFEVTRSTGKFGEEVAGFQGSDNVARRFRPGDDV